jgi:hypothetical protein
VDEETRPEKVYYNQDSKNTNKILNQQQRRVSKDRLGQHNHEPSAKLDFNFLKKNLKLRKSQDKIDKPVRFNTEAYDKDDDSHVVKFKKSTAAGKKSKVFTTSSKNLKSSIKLAGHH